VTDARDAASPPATDPAGSGPLAPGFDDVDTFHRKLHHVAPSQLRGDTAQSSGMRRVEAISGRSVGSKNLWMGQTNVSVATASANHHHGASETAIYVLSGHPQFVFLEGAGEDAHETVISAGPGDYVFVPPWVPHREENPSADEEAVVVVARTTQEPIVVNLPDLSWPAGQRSSTTSSLGAEQQTSTLPPAGRSIGAGS
jgi:uncharacterized RmlC-like cupin family protein